MSRDELNARRDLVQFKNKNLLGEIRQFNEHLRIEVEKLVSVDDKEGSIAIVTYRIDDRMKVYNNAQQCTLVQIIQKCS